MTQLDAKQDAIVETLKEIRDQKLYEQRGYRTFGEYLRFQIHSLTFGEQDT